MTIDIKKMTDKNKLKRLKGAGKSEIKLISKNAKKIIKKIAPKIFKKFFQENINLLELR